MHQRFLHCLAVTTLSITSHSHATMDNRDTGSAKSIELANLQIDQKITPSDD